MEKAILQWNNTSTIYSLNLSAPNTYKNESFSIWVKYLCVGVAGVLSLLGAFGNVVTITAYRKSRKLQTSFNHLITNLCAIDLCFSVLILPAIIPLILSEYQIYSYHTCRIVGYFYHVLTSASVINLVFIAINRYVGIVHSSKYRLMFAANDLRWWLLSTWISAPLFYLPFILDIAFAWTNDHSICQLNNDVPVMFLKIYKVVVCNLLQLIPTIALILLYRAIFAKVKECRKLVEHYPKLGSCSPSYVDPELDDSRFSRGRLRSLRRYSNSRSRRTDSLVTPRPSNSPQNNKYNTMSFLQVPPPSSSNAVEIKGESLIEKQDGIGMTFAFSIQSLDSPHSMSQVSNEPVRGFQSTPDLIHDNLPQSFVDDTSKKSSFSEDINTSEFTTPLLTSERPRRRMHDLKSLHIMSTIDSESNSKSVSCEIGEHVSELPISPLVSPSTEDDCQKCNNSMMKVQAAVPNQRFTDDPDQKRFCKPQFVLGEDDPNNTTVGRLSTLNIQTPQIDFEKPFVDKALSCENVTMTKYEPVSPPIKLMDDNGIKHSPKSTTSSLLRAHSLSCAELPDSDPSRTRLSENLMKESSRRHSISTCSDGVCSGIEPKQKVKSGGRSFKKLNWKKKTALSAPEHEKRAPKMESFAARRVKSEGSGRYRKSWKRHWKRQRNSPSIKIVIEQATSDEQTTVDNSESINYFAEIEEELQACLPKLPEVSDSAVKSYKDLNNINASPNKQAKAIKPNQSPYKLSALNFRLHKRHKNLSKSAESLPSQLPSRKSSLIREEELKFVSKENNNNNIDKNKIINQNVQSPKNKNSPTETDQYQSLDVVYPPRRGSTGDDRRSSITSHVYRYNGPDDCQSRNGSVSCLSFADDCRRRSNTRSPALSRENSDANKKADKSRKISVYSHWQRRKSFFSSFYSGASNESRKHKRRREAEKHIAYSGVVICVAFAISVLPTYAIDIITALTLVSVPADVQLFLAMLSWLHVVINPTLYGYLNPQYRIVFKQMRKKQKQECINCTRCCCFRGSDTKTLSRGPSNASSQKLSPTKT